MQLSRSTKVEDIMGKNWDGLIGMLDELIGRDVEIYESGHTWRGPLKDISVDHGQVTVRLEWSAEQMHDGQWKMITEGAFGINSFGGATDWVSWGQDRDTVTISVPMMGSARILPARDGHLGIVLLQEHETTPG